jgi:CheY-like chemotaxis protein
MRIAVHQVVMNLATNAYHAMEETGGRLRITLKQAFLREVSARSEGLSPGKYAHLIVADTGIGIEKKYLPKIFDPYFTNKDSSKGTGLGLSVVRGIIERVGGSIQAFSKVGEGSEFHVYWPLARLRKGAERIHSSAPVPCGTEKILLADDEASVMKMVRQMLERLGYQVAAFGSGTEALAAFKDDPEGFDLVLTDMTMPEMTGDLLALEVMAIRPTIPVIISTGFSNTLTPEMVRTVGFTGVLKKPVSKFNLAAAVRNALDDAKAAAQQLEKNLHVGLPCAEDLARSA